MATVTTSVADVCAQAKRAAKALARADTATKNAALELIAAALEERAEEILAANARDMQAGREAELGEALLDRLKLDEGRIVGIARAVRQIVALGDPVGEVIDGHRLENGLDVRKVRVPLGVVAVVYEARPNVTIDAAALCLKSGNAIVLRGSSSALHSNAALARIAGEAAVAGGLPEGCVSLVAGGGRGELAELATQKGTVDLIIPRGGEGLKAALEEVATVPVIYAASGNCHVYVDENADFDEAEAIVLNAKTQRPGVCNAAETLLVHEGAAAELVPRIARALGNAGVELRGDERTLELAAGDGMADGEVGESSASIAAATEEDWGTEYLALTLAVKVVASTEEAIEHIGRYGSGHSEAIVTSDTESARAFQLGVDAACVYVNASTRFTDGGEFGMGAEIGNSTQKLHVRGPIGLRELCTFKYLIEVTDTFASEGPAARHGRSASERSKPAPERTVDLHAIGILGGTFNPPHRGHLALARHAKAELGLERMLLMPAHSAPHKGEQADPGPERRLEMCRLAVGDEPEAGLEACGLEIERGGPSYTVDTLRAIRQSDPEAELTFIVGADMARTLPAWREPRALVELAQLAVAEREDTGREEVLRALAPLGARARFLAMPTLDVSSSMVRERVERGESIEGLVEPAVAEYIAAHGLYRSAGGAGVGGAGGEARSAIVRALDASVSTTKIETETATRTGAGGGMKPEELKPEALLGEIARYAADKKAGEIVELDLRGVLGYTDYFVVCSGNTERQTKAIHDGILEGCKREHGLLPRRVEGLSRRDWILMDYLDVVVHIFTPETRAFYRLEQLWGEAPARVAVGEER